MDRDAEPVPFATWDPDDPETNTTPFSHLAKPLRVTLNPGDMLYLPAMWFVAVEIVCCADTDTNLRYHKVAQSCADDGEGFVLAVNYW